MLSRFERKTKYFVDTETYSHVNKVPYDDTFISRKNEIVKYPKVFPNKCEDINLNEKIKAYKKELKKENKFIKHHFKQNENNKDKTNTFLEINKKNNITIKKEDEKLKQLSKNQNVDYVKTDESKTKNKIVGKANNSYNIGVSETKKDSTLLNNNKDVKIYDNKIKKDIFNIKSINKEEKQKGNESSVKDLKSNGIAIIRETEKNENKIEKNEEKNNNSLFENNNKISLLKNQVTSFDTDKKATIQESKKLDNLQNKNDIQKLNIAGSEYSKQEKSQFNDVKEYKIYDSKSIEDTKIDDIVNLQNQVKKFAESSEQIDKIAKIEEEILIHKTQNNELKKQIEILKQQSITLKDEVLGYKQENNNFKKEIIEYKQVNCDIKKEIENYKQENNNFKREILNYKQENNNFKKEIAGYKQENNNFKKEIAGYKQENNNFKKEIAGYKQENNNFKKEIGAYKEELFSSINKIDSLKKQVEFLKQDFSGELLGKTKCSEKSLSLKQSENLKSNKEDNSKEKLFSRFMSIAFAVIFVINVVLLTIVAYNVKYGGEKNLQVNNNSIVVKGDGITTYAIQSAWQSSVCVAVGGNVSDEITFFTKSINRGSGVIYKYDEQNDCSYIITCYHVIEKNENTVYVLFANYLKPIRAMVVGYSIPYDIAVLKIENSSGIFNQKAVKTFDSQFLSIGETVFAIGNSLSSGLSVSNGIISMLNKKVNVESGVCREIQTDATINPGNSGGGLFNQAGELIGIVNAKLSTIDSGDKTINVEGTSYAIPGTLATNIADSIIRNNGFTTRADIGVTFTHSDRYISNAEVNGKLISSYEVRVKEVVKGSVSYGKLQTNDIILSFEYEDVNGETHEIQMYNEYCFEDISFTIKKGSDIVFRIIRPLFNENKTIIINASVFDADL